MGKVDLDFQTITRRIDQIRLPAVEHVFGIATGGIVPASLLAYRLGRSYSLIRINYRAEDNSPQLPAPRVLEPFTPPVGVKRILLVDDVSLRVKRLRRQKSY